jgi:hypothetical protein
MPSSFEEWPPPGAGGFGESSDVVGVRVRERDGVDRLRRHVQLLEALAQATERLVPFTSELNPESRVDQHRRVWRTHEHGVVGRGKGTIGVKRARKSLLSHLE